MRVFSTLLSFLFFLGGIHAAEPDKMIGIIFDCDGTLVDNEYSHFMSWKEALRMRGLDVTEEEFFPFFPGRSSEEIAKIFCRKFDLDSADALNRDKGKIYGRLLAQGMPPIERTIRFIKALAERKEELGIKLGVASASRKEGILINLENLGLREVFDAIVSGKDDLSDYSDPEGLNKPKPYIYLEAAKLLGLDPSCCVAFEDTYTGICAASSAGMTTFAVPNTYTKRQDFSKASFLIEQDVEIEMDDFLRKTLLSKDSFLQQSSTEMP